MPDKTEKSSRKQLLSDLRKQANEQFENSLPMSRDKFKKLFDYLDAELGDKDCDDTNRLTRSFIEGMNVTNIQEVLDWLADKGGYCAIVRFYPMWRNNLINMPSVKVRIEKFIKDDQPGFVECSFADAWGRIQIVQDKVPIVTDKDLDANSNYPQEGIIACEIIKKWSDNDGRLIFTVDTEKPGC